MAATTPPTLTYTPSPLVKYIGLVALLAFGVGGTYLAHLFPDWVGLTTISAFIPTVFFFAAHDLESDTSPPNGMPSWVTFAVVTVATAVYGAVGTFVLVNYTITLVAFLSWLIVVLGAIFHAISEDQGASAKPNTEAWATAFLGIAIGLISYLLANPTAGISAWITTLVAVVPMYIHIQTDGSSVTVSPVTPAPTPPAST